MRTGVPQSRGRLPTRMPAGAGSVRGHVTAAIRALRADARLPPRLLAGRARSPRPASPSHELAAAAVAAARAPGCTMTGTRRPPLPQRFSPRTRPSAPGELPAGRRPSQSCRLAAAGRVASCVSRCLAAPGARAAVPTRSAAEGPPPGSAWALRRSPRSCFRLLALPPARTVKGGRAGGAAAAGCVGAGSRLLRGARPEAGERRGRGAPPPQPTGWNLWKGAAARRAHRRPRPGSSAVSPGAGRLAEPIFRPLGLGCGKPEPGERPRGAGPARWEGAGPLVAGCPGRSASLPPRTADRAVESNSGVITATELRKDCRSHPELGHLWEGLASSPAVIGLSFARFALQTSVPKVVLLPSSFGKSSISLLPESLESYLPVNFSL